MTALTERDVKLAKEAFLEADMDCSGFLEAEELVIALKRLGHEINITRVRVRACAATLPFGYLRDAWHFTSPCFVLVLAHDDRCVAGTARPLRFERRWPIGPARIHCHARC